METVKIISNYSDLNYLLEEGREEDWEMEVAYLERAKKFPVLKYVLHVELRNSEAIAPKSTRVFADKFLGFLDEMPRINAALSQWYIWDGDGYKASSGNIYDDLEVNFYQKLEDQEPAEIFQNNGFFYWVACTNKMGEGTNVSYSSSMASPNYPEQFNNSKHDYNYEFSIDINFNVKDKETVGVLSYSKMRQLLEMIVRHFGGQIQYASVKSDGYSMLYNVFPNIHQAVGWITFVPVKLDKKDFPEVEILEHFEGGTILAIRKKPFGNLGDKGQNIEAIHDAQEVQIKLVDLGVLP